MTAVQQPMTLSERLRMAALCRAETSGEHFDGYVLEPTGVLDLRHVVRTTPGSGSKPADLPRLDLPPAVDTLYSTRWTDRLTASIATAARPRSL